MRPIPVPILKSFETILEKRAISPLERANYKKWLRYFLDSCAKHPVPEARSDQVRLFIDKLREKKQTSFQRNLAAHAVSLYFQIQRRGEIEGADRHTSPGSEAGTDPSTSLFPEIQQVHEGSPFARGYPAPGSGSGAGTDQFLRCAGTAAALAPLGGRLCRYVSVARVGCRDSRARSRDQNPALLQKDA